MGKSTINPTKKSRGRPTIDSEQLNFRLPRDLLDGIDRFASEEAEGASRTEAARRIIRDWLVGHGYLPASPEE